MKRFIKNFLLLISFALSIVIFSCKAETETEYITKTETEYVEKKYAEAVVFTAEDVASAGVKVTMSTATKGAKIYYTTDGIEPTEKSVLYSSPVNFTKDVTVKAVSIKSGMENSPVSVATVSMTEKTVTVEVEKEPDTTPPGKIILTKNSVFAGNGKVLLSWQNPDDEDFLGTRVSFVPATVGIAGQPIIIQGESSGISSLLVQGLENEIEYTFSLVALDKNQNEADGVMIKASLITPPDTSDKTAPAEVSDLIINPFKNRVRFEWKDPSDSDLFGIKITWQVFSEDSRSVVAMDKSSIFVAPGMECIEVPFLENGTEYQFVVKTMDINGNKSSGIIKNASPVLKEPLKIDLDIPKEKSNTSVIVTANITTTAEKIEKVVYKKNGSESASKLLADSDSIEAVQDSLDSSKWIIKIDAVDETANGVYMVAAIDSNGQKDISRIVINNFDFTPPEKIEIVSRKYEIDKNVINLSWKNPMDEDFDHVEINYTTNDGEKNSELSAAECVIGNKKSFDISEGYKSYYTFYIKSVDNIGNKSEPLRFIIVLDDFKEIPGILIRGYDIWTPKSYTFFLLGVPSRIDSFYMSDHLVTRAEYSELIGSDPSSAKAYDKDGKELFGEAVCNNPVNCISWYDAIVYCNKLSIKMGLEPCYTIYDSLNPDDWGEIPFENNTIWDAVDCDFTASGYRLPTEAEWEWAARGGENYCYSGSNDINDVAWWMGNASGTIEVKSKKSNGYGLYDMSGNVMEWCWDWYVSGSCRCVRGGSWFNVGSLCEINARWIKEQSIRHQENGFRLVRSVQ